MDYGDFFKKVKELAETFKKLNKDETIRVISHLDADGISSASILVKLFNKNNIKYSLSIVHQLKKSVLKELSNESYKYFIFSDLGSGQLNNINQYLKNKTIFILDHHQIQDSNLENQNIHHLNPMSFGIDGNQEISGAGVVFFFAKEVDKKLEKMAHVAIIGAIGDIQDKGGFKGLNKKILDIAEKNNKIEVKKGLKLFGFQTKPIYKILEYSTDIYIPGVTGSESGAIQFLKQLNINPKKGNKWKKINDLNKKEYKRLVAGIIIQRAGEENPENILGEIYSLKNEKLGSPLKDAKEFSTLLNACGRLDKASYGIGVCIGDKKIKKKAIRSLKSYKSEIVNAIKWFDKNKKTTLRKENYMVINTGDNILSTIIGTLCSILSKSGKFKENFIIVGISQLKDNNSKVSIRVSGKKIRKDINLKKIIGEIVEQIPNSEFGGHKNAAGAVFPSKYEDKFINKTEEILDKFFLEEIVG